MIKNFADRNTKKFWESGKSKGMPPANLRAVCQRKLLMLDAAKTLDDLKAIPGSHLEQLRHDRLGQHSIRINDQFRLCFLWHDGDAYDVEIADYH